MFSRALSEKFFLLYRVGMLLLFSILLSGYASLSFPQSSLNYTPLKQSHTKKNESMVSPVEEDEKRLRPYFQFRLTPLPTSSVLQASSLFQRQWLVPKGNKNFALAPLETRAIRLHYSSVNEIAEMLQKGNLSLLSAEGKVDADDKGNILWVHDHADRLKKINGVIDQLDQPTLQVYIKAKIINIDSEYMRSLGVAFDSSNQQMSGEQGGIENLTIPIAQLGHNILLEATLDALEREGHARLISDPQLITLDRQSATIEAGEEVPYQQAAYNGGTSVVFKKAVLSLQVTPEILPQQCVLLHLKINQDEVGSLSFNGVPSINTQEITTQVYVKNKSTVVLGGIFEQTDSLQHGSVPGLAKVPVLGGLFHHQDKVNNRSQLLIFVTPVIVKI